MMGERETSEPMAGDEPHWQRLRQGVDFGSDGAQVSRRQHLIFPIKRSITTIGQKEEGRAGRQFALQVRPPRAKTISSVPIRQNMRHQKHLELWPQIVGVTNRQ